jgi:hypothetical protein
MMMIIVFLLVIQEVKIQMVQDNTCNCVIVIQKMVKKNNQDHRLALGYLLILIILQQKYYRLIGMHYRRP